MMYHAAAAATPHSYWRQLTSSKALQCGHSSFVATAPRSGTICEATKLKICVMTMHTKATCCHLMFLRLFNVGLFIVFVSFTLKFTSNCNGEMLFLSIKLVIALERHFTRNLNRIPWKCGFVVGKRKVTSLSGLLITAM